ncbi:hypothetical protein PsYK624_170970 [Phanerochaete sordida]|uniref:Uncharacterized protein n=1 Tax=Phanerochaete sordida TaxID=48140 RepID=A0A9P3LMW7_9APHY|nr:hypothetical protein PsYK624_170970 [Phanerochaete sordida]
MPVPVRSGSSGAFAVTYGMLMKHQLLDTPYTPHAGALPVAQGAASEPGADSVVRLGSETAVVDAYATRAGAGSYPRPSSSASARRSPVGMADVWAYPRGLRHIEHERMAAASSQASLRYPGSQRIYGYILLLRARRDTDYSSGPWQIPQKGQFDGTRAVPGRACRC